MKPTIPPSPAAVAAAVAKSAALVEAEESLAALRADRERLMDSVRALASRRGERDVDRQLTALHEQREALEGQIVAARKCRAAALEPHQQRVRAALAPVARDTSERITGAVSELAAALRIGSEVVEAGEVRDMDVPALSPYHDPRRLCHSVRRSGHPRRR